MEGGHQQTPGVVVPVHGQIPSEAPPPYSATVYGGPHYAGPQPTQPHPQPTEAPHSGYLYQGPPVTQHQPWNPERSAPVPPSTGPVIIHQTDSQKCCGGTCCTCSRCCGSCCGSRSDEDGLRSCAIGQISMGCLSMVLNAIAIATNTSNAKVSHGIWGGAMVGRH